MTIYKDYFLHAKSEFSNNPINLIYGTYDLGIIFPSWDNRCLELLKCTDLSFKNSILPIFSGKNSAKYSKLNQSKLIDYAKQNSNQTYSFEGESIDFNYIWQNLSKQIINQFIKNKSSLNIFLDLSTCPKYYAMSILSTCILRGIAKLITIFYSEGEYHIKTDVNQNLFTAGKWDTIAIPSLKNIHDPGKRKYYLVSVGFEGAKTMQVISKKDPERISILFPDPGVKKEYVSIAESENEILFNKYKVPDKEIIRAPAGDAIMAWKKISERSPERPNDENIHYLCCGTKPHALALSLRAIARSNATVLYRKPNSYQYVDVKPIGQYWRYDIKDISAIN